jgi:hypothetical protein
MKVVVENIGLRLFTMPKLSVGKYRRSIWAFVATTFRYWATWSVRGTRIFICLML